MNYPQFWIKASLRQRRIYSILFVLVLAVLATLIGLMVPMSPTQAKMISDQLNQTLTQGNEQGTLVQDIFLNNFPLCLLMFVPLAGFGIGMFILFSTGQAFRAVFEIQAASGATTATPEISAATAFLALALIGAVFLLEYVSYSIGMAESIWLFRRIMQGEKRLMGELKYLAIFIGIVALLLIIGAVVETYTLSIGA
ncbi:MAG: stage II sporulation protein M [Candidatus Bathyarchaeota archaeon]|nr:stage II sporulation protein M [Candidatus Bathyarchaeota archaeon]